MNPRDPIDVLDRWTRTTDRAVGVLFLKDPVRTSLGFVLGGTLSVLNVLFEPALRTVTFANFAAMSWWSWLLPGVLIMHVPTIRYLLQKPSVGSHSLDTFFAVIDRGDFTPTEMRQHYRRLIERLVDDVAATHAPQKQEGTAPGDAND